MVYKRLAGIRGVPDLEAIAAELEERYGPIPAARRHAAARDGAAPLAEGPAGGRARGAAATPIVLEFHDTTPVTVETLLEKVRGEQGRLRLTSGSALAVRPAATDHDGDHRRAARALAEPRNARDSRSPRHEPRLASVLAVVAIVCAVLAAGSGRAEVVNRIIATVDGDPITAHEVQRVSRRERLEPSSPSTQALEALITDKLLEKEVDERKDRGASPRTSTTTSTR